MYDSFFRGKLRINSLLQDALYLTEFELTELLDVGSAEVTTAVARISAIVCPPYNSLIFCSIYAVGSVLSTVHSRTSSFLFF